MLRSTLALLLLTSVAHAGNNELSATQTARSLHTSSANAVTEDGMVGGSLGYARRIDIPIARDLTLWARANFGWGGTDGEMATRYDLLFPQNKSRMRFHLFSLSERLIRGAARFPNDATFVFPEDPGVETRIEIR